ncbi:MAG: cytochrome c-type biogenesis protein CcmH [Chloroflexi bacterium]|nr:cytochrome c-type biogenesis protein CcmH [Chloroflexota bacterium]
MRTSPISLRLGRAAAAFLMLSALSVAFAVPVHAQDYNELPPDLEERAKRLDSGVMCPQCAGQTIDESNAPIAAAMRTAIRSQLRDGATDDAIMESLVQSYGDGILASPPTEGFSLLVWLVPPLALLVGAATVAFTVRNMRRGRPAAESAAAGIGDALDTPTGEPLPFDLVDRELGEEVDITEKR